MHQVDTFYLCVFRLDLEDFNHEVEEELYITSMVGTWMRIVEGFGGMRVKETPCLSIQKSLNSGRAYPLKLILGIK